MQKCRYLYIDIDVIDTNEPKTEWMDLIDEIWSCGLEPTMIISSGTGYHVYFKLNEEIEATKWDQLEASLYEYLTQYLRLQNMKLDQKCKDRARILRLAGTLNSKNGNIAEIVHYNALTNNITTLEKLINAFSTNETEYSVRIDDSNKQEFLTKLYNAILPHFVSGQRQFMTIFLAGYLAKTGFEEDEVKAFYEQYLKPIDDKKDTKQRLAGITRTFKVYKEGRPVKGITGLKSLGVNTTDFEFKTNTDLSNLFIDGLTLKEKEFPPREFIVENFLPVGLVMFAGKSKLGKSWFALYLALHVATNTDLFGIYKIKKSGHVYYFALEDYEYRLKQRQEKILESSLILKTYDLQKLHFFVPDLQKKFQCFNPS